MDEMMSNKYKADEIARAERDAKRLTLGCGVGAFVVAIIAAVLVALLGGCRTTRVITETVTTTDTVTISRDSIIIHERIDTVEIALPTSYQYIEIPVEHDTVSILSDKYYTSTAAVFNGRLRHSLRSNPGASLVGNALVRDTTKIKSDSTAINNSSSHIEIKEVPVNHLYWWQKLLMWLGGIGVAGGVLLLALRLNKSR